MGREVFMCVVNGCDFESDSYEEVEEHWKVAHRLRPITAGREDVLKNTPLRAQDQQVGGDHYMNMPIQPGEFIYRNNLGWHEGNAIKYICRHEMKGGIVDIDKAIHYLTLLKELKYGE